MAEPSMYELGQAMARMETRIESVLERLAKAEAEISDISSVFEGESFQELIKEDDESEAEDDEDE